MPLVSHFFSRQSKVILVMLTLLPSRCFLYEWIVMYVQQLNFTANHEHMSSCISVPCKCTNVAVKQQHLLLVHKPGTSSFSSLSHGVHFSSHYNEFLAQNIISIESCHHRPRSTLHRSPCLWTWKGKLPPKHCWQRQKVQSCNLAITCNACKCALLTVQCPI